MGETGSNISKPVGLASLADRDVERLRASLPEMPPAAERPVMVIVSGLPGTGKSYFSRRIVSQVPLLVMESDVMRKVLFPDPGYTPSENRRLFRAYHSLIDDLLGHKVPLLLDATNLVESHREGLYRIAEGRGVGIIIVYLKASPDVVYQRLEGRSKGMDREDNSEADWRVYRRMQSTVQPIGRDHFAFDTSGDISPAVARVVQEIRCFMSTD
ncbi:MAG: ATP-binding protein [Dehalococcoidia bacterium]|nr:ATP-binding protein [Dehalococcoidia bacterium]